MTSSESAGRRDRRGAGRARSPTRAVSSCTQRTRSRSASRTAASSPAAGGSAGAGRPGGDRGQRGRVIGAPIDGGARLSSTGCAGDELGVVERGVLGAGGGEDAQRGRCGGGSIGVLVEQQTGEHLVAVQRRERRPGRLQDPHELVGSQVGERRARRAGRRRRRRSGRRRGPAGRRAGGRRATRRAAPGRWPRVEPGPHRTATRRSAPRRSRSAATRPPTEMTTGDSRQRRADVVPVMASASRSPSRSGASQRSTSSVRSGARTSRRPGPGRTPARCAGFVADRGDRPALQQHHAGRRRRSAHSMSCGPPNVAAARRASADERRRVCRARSAAGASARAWRAGRSRVSVRCTPSTSPLTSRSGPPGTAATTSRSRRPVTGSAPNSTPPTPVRGTAGRARRSAHRGWTR